jgi:quinol monooxygenase YgiN
MNHTSFIVMTEVTTKPERQAAVWKAMTEIAEVARGQAGCIEYQILQSAENPAVTVNYERWASEAEHAAFMESAAVAAFVEAIDIPNSFIGNPGPVTYKIMA